MPNDSTATADVLNLTSREGKPRPMTAEERRAFEAGKAAANREAMRQRFGSVDFTPVPPFPLSEAAQRHWNAGLKAIPLALKRPGCEDALARYATAMSTFEKATAEIERSGLVSRGRQGEPTRSPLLIVRSSAMVQIREARRELGFPTAWTERALRKGLK